jgi:SAM-dependent methyltransferase
VPTHTEILDFATELVTRHALGTEQAQQVNIHAQNRGGVGGRGYGVNAHGREIAWWVHPKRVHQELEFVLEHLALAGTERLITIGCGPAFHEVTLAKFFPNLTIVATDFDAAEIATARQIADEVGVTNIEFINLPGEQVNELEPASFDHAFSIAVLHDVPGLEVMCKGLTRTLKPGAHFAFTYNPPRQRAQFPEQPPLRDTIARSFTIEHEEPLVTPAHSREYFGSIADRSEQERGYPLRWDAISARL